MKLFGYFDDGINWFYNWQTSMGLWNILIIPLEIFIVYFITFKFRRIIM